MTITVLKLSPGQKIARPYNQASSPTELADLLTAPLAHALHPTSPGKALTMAKQLSDDLYKGTDTWTAARKIGIDLNRIDTEEPVLTIGGCKFYAFTQH